MLDINKEPKTHHVLPDPDGGRYVKRGDASSNHEIKKDAIDRDREISRNQGTEYRNHKKDRRIADSVSYGNDLHPLKC